MMRLNYRNTGHRLHDSFFKDIYKLEELAKDILRLALAKKELDLFDLDSLSVYKDSTQNSDTGKGGVGDLHYKMLLKKYPHLLVHFSVFFEHKIKDARKAIKQLRGYSLRAMDDTEGLVFGILINQGRHKLNIPNNYLDYVLGKHLPSETINTLAGLFSNYFIRVVDLPALTVEQICRNDIKSAPALLTMKFIRNMTHKTMSMIMDKCHSLNIENKSDFLSKLMSYVCKADNRYDRKVLSEIEEKYFPNLPTEVKIMERIEFGFDEARTEGHKKGFKEGIEKGIKQGIKRGIERGIEQGIEQTVMRLLKSGEMSDGDICKITGISEQQLLKIKHKIN